MMMDYSELTGVELSLAVAKKWLPEKQHKYLKIKRCIHDGEYLDYLCVTFDFENNPTDAWPIILENKIDINFLKCEPHTALASNGDYYIRGKNPLRAAMIVYLMMGDDDG